MTQYTPPSGPNPGPNPGFPQQPPIQAPPPEQYAANVPADVSGKKVAAGVLGIVLGSLGIHKFILGYTTAGIIMLFVTLLTSWPTFGCSGGLMWIFGLIEGIIYLTKTDADFYQTYIVNKKPWF